MPSQNHIHKYHRRRLGISHTVWACALPNCTHYTPKHMESMVEGKLSICHQCGEEFTLTIDSLKEDNPRCDECRYAQIKSDDNVPLTDVMRDFLDGKR